MNNNTQTTILFGIVAVLSIVVIFFSVKLRIGDSAQAANTNQENMLQDDESAELTDVPEAEITPEAPETPQTETITMVKTTDTVNVRTGPGKENKALGQAPKGSEFELIEAQDNGWSKIKYEDSEAYIKSDYLEQYEVEVEIETPETPVEGENAENPDGEEELTDLGSEDVVIENTVIN